MKEPIPKFYGTAKNGDISFENWTSFSRYLLTLEDTRIEIVVRKYRKDRTNPQNRYWHGVVCKILGNHFGYTGEEMHDALKIKFLRKTEPGKPVTVGSTARLNTDQFNELIKHVQIWAATEHGVYIPDPEKVET